MASSLENRGILEFAFARQQQPAAIKRITPACFDTAAQKESLSTRLTREDDGRS